MIFEWDDKKATVNLRKHGISFAEAATVFSDSNAIELCDQGATLEERWILVGMSLHTRVLLVVFVEKESEIVRIISARKTTRNETNQYFSQVKL